MSNPTPIQRLIVCVDGGKSSNRTFGHSNTTNISKLISIIREGQCIASDGTPVHQSIIYDEAIEESPTLLTTFKSREIEGQIEFITKTICQILKSPKDEIFFYGSGHGAYIVRAVAGVLHHMGLPQSWSMIRFHDNYLNALELYKAKVEEDSIRGLKLLKSLRSQCHDPPKIKFMGVFDTVKDKTDTKMHDLSFNETTKIFRHAIALNEGEADLVGVSMTGEEKGRSLQQAWFVGNTDDLCGGLQHDGLSMYPLQWMILESMRAGLVLHTPQPSTTEENALALAFPQFSGELPSIDNDEHIGWQSVYKNGMKIRMYDLQPTHAASRSKGNGSHTVHLKSGPSFYSHPRKVFGSRGLSGWSSNGNSCTIVHPSVYCLTDRYPRLLENQRLKLIKKELASFQEKCMESDGSSLPPWLEGMQLQANGVKAFRILVCGKTGVGKSTLINKVFGVELTEESTSYVQGVHNINHAFESPSHPGLLIHDSRGWQAGSNSELELIAKFLRRRAYQKDPAEALHVIWFCVDSDVSRIEEADRKTFEIITQHSHHVPVFIIGTKKDKIANFRKMQLLEQYLDAEELYDVKKTHQMVKEETEKHVQQQFSELIAEFSKIKHYRSDVQLCLSKNDDDGIKDLVGQTLGLISDDRVRLFCVAAQVVSVDQKISSAVTETMRLGAHVVRTAVLPLPCSGIVGTPTISRMLCEQILQCFGFPKAAPEAVEEIMSRVVMDNLKRYMAVAMTQFLVISGATVGAAVATMGIGSVVGVSACIFAAPPAARMLLKCACDMILILERSFRYGGKFVSVKQIEDAAKYYTKTTVKTFGGKERLLQQQVHEEVEKMIPLTSLTTAWRFSKLRVGLEEIIYRNRFGKTPTQVSSGSSEKSPEKAVRTQNRPIELGNEAQLHELEGSQIPVEIGARASFAELEGDLPHMTFLLREAKAQQQQQQQQQQKQQKQLSPSQSMVVVSPVSKSTSLNHHQYHAASVEVSPVASLLSQTGPDQYQQQQQEQEIEHPLVVHRSKGDLHVPTSKLAKPVSGKLTSRFSLRKSKTTT